MSNYWAEFLTLAMIHLMAVASPGPDFAIIIKQTLRYGKRIGTYTAWGIGTGILLHVGLSILGFAGLIQKYDWAQLTFQWVGALYLGYIGVMSLKARPAKTEEVHSEKKSIPAKKAFFIGLGVNALNVKALLFFLSVFTAIVSIETPLEIQIGYGIYLAIATGVWFTIMSNLFGHRRVRKSFYSHAHWFEKIVGIFLIYLAIMLILM